MPLHIFFASFSHVVVEVLLIDLKRALSEGHVFEWLFQVENSATDDVITFEEVPVVSLNSHSVVSARVLHLVN
jgi:hypothetical protein